MNTRAVTTVVLIFAIRIHKYINIGHDLEFIEKMNKVRFKRHNNYYFLMFVCTNVLYYLNVVIL